MQVVRNTRRRETAEIPRSEIVGIGAPDRVLRLLAHCPRYAPTPLLRLDDFAGECGVRQIFVKDEARRLGLQSFKALGGIYAILELLARDAERRYGNSVAASDLLSPRILSVARGMTFVCASDGNHGRSVAAGARLVGGNCVVFLHRGVSERRVEWITRLGASVVRTDGSYDESVEAAEDAARAHGWTLVADTSETCEDEVPGLIVRGYTVVADEMLRQFEVAGTRPTHVFVQAGVGGLAAAVFGQLAARLASRAPISVVVEPESSCCLLESCRKGEATELPPTSPTIYAMLECNRPSPLAWEILDPTASFFMSVADSFAVPAMRRVGNPTGSDPKIVAGESGAAGCAALTWACSLAHARDTLGLDPNSIVALINTEGATDPIRYRELTGLEPSHS